MNDLPKGWEWKKLGEICLNKGQYGSGAKKVDFDGKVRYVRITDIEDDGNLNQDLVSPSTIEEDCILEENDLLFARSGSVGRTYLHKTKDSLKYQYAGYLIRFKINTAMAIPEFVYYVVNSPNYFEWVESIKKSGTISNINAKEFASYELPVPPLKTQKEIITILKRAESLKQKREEANNDTNTIIQSIFSDMFGDPQTNEKDWKMTTLLDVSAEKPQYGSGAKAVNFDNKLRYIRITDVDGKGDLRKDSVASPSEFEEKYLLKKGDLLFARSGATVGKTYLHQEEKDNSIYAGYMIRFRFNLEICNPGFIFALTRTKYYQNWLLGNQTQVAQPNINAQQYGGLKIFLPPIALQNKFASIVEKIESLKEKQKETTSDIGNLFDALMQAAFKGELAG